MQNNSASPHQIRLAGSVKGGALLSKNILSIHLHIPGANTESNAAKTIEYIRKI